MAAKGKGKFMDVLEDVSDVSEDDSDGAEQEKGMDVGGKKKPKVTVEDLQRAGYKSTSMMNIRPVQDGPPPAWNWSDGRAAKGQETEESAEERQATRTAATEGVEATALYASAALLHNEQLREERKAEKERLEKERKLSYNQKEKRKRDEGKTSRGKSYVEEEKRMQRSLGMYSGFD